jgi:hypothetical protein
VWQTAPSNHAAANPNNAQTPAFEALDAPYLSLPMANAEPSAAKIAAGT